MRVFLDTNVLASSFATRGLSADVVRIILAEHELVVGEVVLKELKRVLRRKIDLPKKTVEDIIALLRRYEVVPKPRKPPNITVRDPDALWVLASALAARVDVLVTGDRDLLAIRDQVDIVIADPRGFWNLLKEQKEK